jgi:hypothetical protein
VTLQLPTGLSDAQQAALEAVRSRGGHPDPRLEEAAALVRDHACVTLNFHPQRVLRDGRTVADGLLADGVYRGQFETGISNGSATAFLGGLRDGWEDTLFEGAYRDSPPAERPKYGALALLRHGDGAAPRFGCCYVRLRQALTRRCTFTWGDSHLGPAHVGTADCLQDVLGAQGAWSMHFEAARWTERASAEDNLQHLKQLWHCLVAFGTTDET